MTDVIPIHYKSFVVGHITPETSGFAYHPTWLTRRNAFPVSLTMPLGEMPVPAEILLPWLMNLLPEGNALPTLGRNLGISPTDIIGLVAEIGRDTAGALSIGHPRLQDAPGYIPIPNGDALERMINEVPARPFLAGRAGVSMSLAGAQDKLPVALIDGTLSIPVNGAPSTHIIKPDITRLYGSVHNEALCLILATHLGQKAAEVITGRAGKRTYLLVTRYDRVSRNRHWLRLHQEDFCQALGKPPSAKYEHNQTGTKGPSLIDFFTLVRRRCPPSDILRLRDSVILNVLITNVDAHAKNLSLLLSTHGATIAPLYDLMCGDAWSDITQNMAQDIGGQTRGRHVEARHWRRMAAGCGLNGTAMIRRVRELATKVATTVDDAANQVRAMPAGDHPALPLFVDAIKARCRIIIANLAPA